MTVLLHKRRMALADRMADTGLWLLAAVNMLIALSFLVVLASLSPANAQDLPVCGGNNLLTRYETNDPAAFAKLRAEADAVPNGKTIFWKIEKDGKPASWLLGTMHVTDPRVVAMPDGARKAFDEAATVVVESDEIADEKKAGVTILARPDLTMFNDGKSITDFLSKDDAETLAEGLKGRGLSLAAVERMKPWMIASFVALPACEIARKTAGAAFLDQKLAKDALAEGKTLKGLETLIEQISALDSLPIEPQIQGLVQTVALGDTLQDVIETMSQLYLAGDVGMIMPMMRAAAPQAEGDVDSYADFEQRIIIDRNHTMATRAAPILADGNVFMAVGALHLPGAEGVVELLRKEGFTVTAVN
ncbi:TraB/GumN family protein [Shinella sedimenti]|uniref:TraB/GumN family protein n=1 Tax=Shinella sedimenti TaxID=2919913 RepID=A0ABT0CMJ1_9HYPH|nr:TraB/GumN family protein [Shinella sedimenti]MCJ8149827.1 TraB/GumN family protein [Shinella sedimenti]